MRTHTFAPAGTNLSPHLGGNEKGRDLVVGDVHGHFATLRRALDELEVGEHDRVFSLGIWSTAAESTAAKDWIAGADPSQRFHLVIRGNHEQMMLEALAEGPPPRRRIWDENAWTLWEMNGGKWWDPQATEPQCTCLDERIVWTQVLCPG